MNGRNKTLEQQGPMASEPLRAETVDLAALISGITDENRHEAIDMGPIIGDEAW